MSADLANTEVADVAAVAASGARQEDGTGPFGGICGFLPELRLVFRRRRNQLLLLVVVGFPVLIGVGLKIAAPHSGGGGGGGGGGGPQAFFNQLAGNGVFLTLIALQALLILGAAGRGGRRG